MARLYSEEFPIEIGIVTPGRKKFFIKHLTKYPADCIYSIYTVMTHKDFNRNERRFEVDGKNGG